MQDFRDKVAVVTGGAGGIGKALVKALLDENASRASALFSIACNIVSEDEPVH